MKPISMTDYVKFLKQPLKLEMFTPCDEDGNVIDNPEKRDDYAWDIVYEELKTQGYSVESEEESDITITKAKKIHIERYQKAKEKVLFKGFYIKTRYINNKRKEGNYTVLTNDKIDLFGVNQVSKKWVLLVNYKTIACLFGYDLELTDNAIKQLGL